MTELIVLSQNLIFQMSSISIQLRVEIQFAVLLTVTEVKKLRKDIALTKSSLVRDTHLLKLTNI